MEYMFAPSWKVKFLETVPLLANQLPRADLPTLAAALVEKRWVYTAMPICALLAGKPSCRCPNGSVLNGSGPCVSTEFGRCRRWKPGEFLAKQGDLGRELNILKSGTCAVLRKSRALAESARVRAFVCLPFLLEVSVSCHDFTELEEEVYNIHADSLTPTGCGFHLAESNVFHKIGEPSRIWRTRRVPMEISNTSCSMQGS